MTNAEARALLQSLPVQAVLQRAQVEAVRLDAEQRRRAVKHRDSLSAYALKELQTVGALLKEDDLTDEERLIVAGNAARIAANTIGLACAHSERGGELLEETVAAIAPTLATYPQTEPGHLEKILRAIANEAAISEGLNAWMWVPVKERKDAHERYPFVARAQELLDELPQLPVSEQLRWLNRMLQHVLSDPDVVRDALASQVSVCPASARDRLAKVTRDVLRGIYDASAELPEMNDGPIALDAAYIDATKALGTNGEEGAAVVLRELPKKAKRTPIYGWLPSLSPVKPPTRFVVLVKCCFADVVFPALKREEQLEPLRIAADLANNFNAARNYGGVPTEHGIMVNAARDKPVLLFDDKLGVVVDGSEEKVSLRKVLTGFDIRTYLVMVGVWLDCGMATDGSFWFDGDEALLDIMGAAKNKETKGSRVYERYLTRDREAVAASRAKFRRIRVRQVGELEALAGDALVDEVRREGKTIRCNQSRLIVDHIRGGSSYARIPRAVTRLSADDVPLATGIALVTRNGVLAYKQKHKPIEAPARLWLEHAGIDATAGVRRYGGNVFWAREVERLVRVAEEAEIGKLSVAGSGSDAVLSLKLNDALSRSYDALVKSANEQARASRAARVQVKRTTQGRRKR